jgi:hypothetical protein
MIDAVFKSDEIVVLVKALVLFRVRLRDILSTGDQFFTLHTHTHTHTHTQTHTHTHTHSMHLTICQTTQLDTCYGQQWVFREDARCLSAFGSSFAKFLIQRGFSVSFLTGPESKSLAAKFGGGSQSARPRASLFSCGFLSVCPCSVCSQLDDRRQATKANQGPAGVGTQASKVRSLLACLMRTHKHKGTQADPLSLT